MGGFQATPLLNSITELKMALGKRSVECVIKSASTKNYFQHHAPHYLIAFQYFFYSNSKHANQMPITLTNWTFFDTLGLNEIVSIAMWVLVGVPASDKRSSL